MERVLQTGEKVGLEEKKKIPVESLIISKNVSQKR
jgi:hypothetical protein